MWKQLLSQTAFSVGAMDDQILLLLPPEAAEMLTQLMCDVILDTIRPRVVITEGDEIFTSPFASQKDTEITAEQMQLIHNAATLLYRIVQEVHNRSSSADLQSQLITKGLCDSLDIARALWGATLFVDAYYGPHETPSTSWTFYNKWLLEEG